MRTSSEASHTSRGCSALTPPPVGRAWTRVALLPPLIWVIATGAYPGQLPAFGIIGCVYLAAASWQAGPAVRRRYRWALLLAVVSGAAACLAVLLPYVLALDGGELIRVAPATVAARAHGSFGITDILGLYLNSFAWHQDGSITSWSLSVPVLIGLAFVTRNILSRQLPLVAAGGIALTLAVTPKIEPLGKAMVALGPLFPSRFPAADYKAMVAIALVVLSADAWSELPTNRVSRTRMVAALGGLLLLAALLAPSRYASVTRWPLLLSRSYSPPSPLPTYARAGG